MQVAFAAGTVHLMKAARPSIRGKGLGDFESCMAALRIMGQTWKSARQSEAILGQLRDEWCPRSTVNGVDRNELSGAKALLERNPRLAEELQQLGWAPPHSSAALGPSDPGEAPQSVGDPLLGDVS